MQKSVISNIFLFLLLVIGQVVVFNNLILFNSAVALVFLYFIISLPITTNINAVTALSFLLGLSVDIFQDTPGLNAFCCTVLGFFRPFIFHLYVPHDEDFSGRRICINNIGLTAYLKYMLTFVVLYCLLYFIIESFNYSDIDRLLIRVLASSAYTFIIIYAIDSLTVKRSEKRL